MLIELRQKKIVKICFFAAISLISADFGQASSADWTPSNFGINANMSDLLHNWEKKSAARQKEYRRFLQNADKKGAKNKVLER
ncbi:MAG: hypothetical protein ABUM51_09285, partial [Bacteroidota bacterium]